MPTFTGWAIDRDHLAEPSDDTRVGYGQREEERAETQDSFDRIIGRTVTVATDLKASDVADPVRFRCLDDDGEVYYGGAISRSWIDSAGEFAFSPLDFATADAGATEMQYRECGESARSGSGNWKTL